MEKTSLCWRLAEIAVATGEQKEILAAYDFYVCESREQLRAIMRCIKSMYRISHIRLTDDAISEIF